MARIDLREGASPGTPGAGYVRLYADEDGQLHVVADDGTDGIVSMETTSGEATGYSGHWAHTAIAGTAITVIPDGTGDVGTVGTFIYAIYDNATAASSGGVVTLTPGGGAVSILSDGTNTCQMTCAANGSVTVARSAGTSTFKLTLWGTWI